jgi:hypothetical protein
MVPKHTLLFHEVQGPITELVTKFGGQPTWYSEPQWPLSRRTDQPMRFICQIALDQQIFGAIPGRMAYIFMTDTGLDDDEREDEDYTDVGETWSPDGGENAVIIQPGLCDLPTRPLTTGPTLYKIVPSGQRRVHQEVAEPCEFAVELLPGFDPDVLIEDENASDEGWQEFTRFWDENKIGGTPAFLQGPEFPAGGNWRLLLQLNSNQELFELNFGDAGIGYAFLSTDGTRGKFLWQCV